MNRACSALAVCAAIAICAGASGTSAQQLEVLTVGGDPTLGRIYLLAGLGANVVVQAGEEGAVFVDSGTPASRVANGVVQRTRLLCPYPQVARYSGKGSTDDAANFSCVKP